MTPCAPARLRQASACCQAWLGTVNLARLALYAAMEAYAWQVPDMPVRTYVDDLAQLAIDRRQRADRSQVDEFALGVARGVQLLVKLLRQDNYVISPKSVAMTNDGGVKRAAGAAARALEVNLEFADAVIDLGLDTSWRRRALQRRRARHAKAKRKVAEGPSF